MRNLGQIDLFFIPIAILVLFIYGSKFNFFDKDDSSTPIGYIAGGVFNLLIAVGGFMTVLLAFMIWMILTEIGANNKWFDAPPRIVRAELIQEGNTLRCPDTYTMYRGRHGNPYCEKEIPR